MQVDSKVCEFWKTTDLGMISDWSLFVIGFKHSDDKDAPVYFWSNFKFLRLSIKESRATFVRCQIVWIKL